MAAKKEDKTSDEELEPAPSKLPLIMVIILVLNLGATGFNTYMSLNPIPPPPAAPAQANPMTDPLSVWGPTVDLDAFVVNLNEPTSARYLRTRIQIELKDEIAATDFERVKPVVRDEALGYLSNLTVEDTMGAKNKTKIRDDLLAMFKESAGSDKVKRLFFTEFVVQ